LPDFTASTAGLPTAAFLTGLATGFAGAFFNAFRAAGAAAAFRAEGFDFAADFVAAFLDFATALAMDSSYLKKVRRLRALHHFEGFRASRETLLSRARNGTS
jgi:hypothetical protein